MTISMIVAAADNNVIGKDNQLLWKLPNDLAFFKNKTWGLPMVMGRKTYESMSKYLKGRVNIVVTRNRDWAAGDAVVVASIEEGLVAAEKEETNEIFIIGGGEIYRQGLHLTDKVYLTRVHASPEGDASFPELPAEEWELTESLPFPADEKHTYDYRFETWLRKR